MIDDKSHERVREAFCVVICPESNPDDIGHCGACIIRRIDHAEDILTAARRLLASERLNRDQLENEALDESTAYRKRSGLKEQVSAIAAVSYEDGWLDAYEVAQDRILGPAPEAESEVCGTCGGMKTCPTCFGSGGGNEPHLVCPSCAGEGHCPDCAPSGSPAGEENK